MNQIEEVVSQRLKDKYYTLKHASGLRIYI